MYRRNETISKTKRSCVELWGIGSGQTAESWNRRRRGSEARIRKQREKYPLKVICKGFKTFVEPKLTFPFPKFKLVRLSFVSVYWNKKIKPFITEQ